MDPADTRFAAPMDAPMDAARRAVPARPLPAMKRAGRCRRLQLAARLVAAAKAVAIRTAKRLAPETPPARPTSARPHTYSSHTPAGTVVVK
jgi:hypothetical protein